VHFSQISAVFEYCSMVKAKVEFREVAVADIPNNHFAFACECKIAGKPYPQGVGNTKKKAKTAAARAAMDIILKHGLILSGINYSAFYSGLSSQDYEVH